MKRIETGLPLRGASAPRRKRVLALVGDTQVGLWVTRSLGRGGLTVFSVCATPNGLPAHSRYSAGAWVIESGAGDPGFADEVLDLARRLNVASVMTIAEGYHAALIAARDRFEPEIVLLSPAAEAFARATDKDAMQRLCRELDIPVARGTTLDRLAGGEEALRYPVVLRTGKQNDPNAGRAPWKAAYAEDEGRMRTFADDLGPIAANVVVQEYHPGVEEHVQVLMHRDEAFMTGDYIGQDHMPLAGGVTVMRTSCDHRPVVRDAVRLLKALGWEGIAGVQFHYDPATEEYIFLEINPRFIGGLPTVIMAGFDAPFLLWQSRFEPERMRRTPYEAGLRTRILGGHANWLLAMLRGDPMPPGEQRMGRLAAATRFLWNLGPWTRDDTFWLGDIKPALVDWKMMLRRLGAGSVDIVGNAAADASKDRKAGGAGS